MAAAVAAEPAKVADEVAFVLSVSIAPEAVAAFAFAPLATAANDALSAVLLAAANDCAYELAALAAEDWSTPALLCVNEALVAAELAAFVPLPLTAAAFPSVVTADT